MLNQVVRNNCAGSCVSHSPSCLVRKSCSTCSFAIGCLWTIGLAFPSYAFFLQMALRTLFAVSNVGSPTNGPRLVFWWLFKVSLCCCLYCTERRNFEIFSVFLLHRCIKNFQAVIYIFFLHLFFRSFKPCLA